MRHACWILVLAIGCGGSEADALGVGAECASSADCNGDDGQDCLLGFKGGYCGEVGCASDADCAIDAACVAHVDGMNYCFRVCVDKAECNANRSPANEANCSSNVTFVDPPQNRKACVPPSG